MDCKACGERIPEDSEYCTRCGAEAAPGEEPPAAAPPPEAEGTQCRRCGESLPPQARFCPRCGEPQEEGAPPAPERRDFMRAEEEEALRNQREAADRLPYVHWFLVLVFIIITLGLYQPVWFLRRRWGLAPLSRHLSVSAGAMWFCLAYLAFSLMANLGLAFLDGLMEGAGAMHGGQILAMVQSGFSVVDMIVNVVVLVLMLVQTFRVRRILLEHFHRTGQQVKVRWFWTLLLTILYLQHKINKEIIEPHLED